MSGAKGLAVLIVILGASSYGFLSSIVKLAYGAGFGENAVTASQMFWGTSLTWVLLAFNRGAWVNPFRGPWIRLSLIGIVGLALTTILYNEALSEMDASLSIVLLFQFTWITIMLESLAKRSWPNRTQWLAVALILAGTCGAVNVLEADLSRFTLKGVLFGLGASVSYGLFLFLTGRVQTTLPSLMKSVVMLTAALPFVFLLYPREMSSDIYGGELALWGCVLGLFGQVIPTLCFNIGIPRIGSSLSAMMGSMELPVALLGALILLREPIFGMQWFGMLLILAGIYTAQKADKR